MEQNFSDLSQEDRDSLIKKSLIEKKFLDQETINKIISKNNKLLNSAKKEIQGKCYSVNYFEKKFIVFDTYTNEISSSVDLPGNIQNQHQFKYNPDEWESWGNTFPIIDLNELNKDSDIFFDKSGLFGLAITDDFNYLFNPEIDKQKLLGITNQYFFGARSKIKTTFLPFDMQIFPDNRFLLLMNRGEGKVYFFDINLEAFTREVIVRGTGSNKAINMAISLKQDKIYFTDNVSQMLGIYDITQQNYDTENIGIGILGNIVLSPDENSFYVIVTRPEPSLKQLSVKTFEEIKEFPLKGELFSHLDDPCDILTISPDKKFLAFMTYMDTPVPYTPVFTIIDLEKNKAVKRFSIKDDTKPMNLTFSKVNPVGSLYKSFEELIREENIIEDSLLNEVIRELYFEKEEEIEGLVEVESENYEFEVDTNEEENQEFTPKKTKHVIISPKVDKFIIEILLGSFWQKHDIDLTEHPDEIKKLNELAEIIRKKLEFYDSYIVNVNRFFEGKSLHTIIMREYILEMFAEEESKNRTEVKTAPSKCVNCGSNLMGSWECMVCGFKMEKPEDTYRRKSASFDQINNLQKGNYFILDSDINYLAEVDQYRNIIWKPTLKGIDIKSINNIYRLENKNNIILDKSQSKIFEISYKGRFVWEYKAKRQEGEIFNPNNFTMLNDSNLLIADTGNNRIIEVDLDGNLIWEYSLDLYQPHDIQKTYDDTYLVTDYGNNRILELAKIYLADKNTYDFNVIWQYGNSLNINKGGAGNGNNELNKPISAFKEIDGNYLIIDSGNKRIIIVNENKEIIWEYQTIQSNEELSISRVLRVTRLKNQDLIIVGDNKVIQLMPLEKNKIKWASKIELLGDKSKAISIKHENIDKITKNVSSEKSEKSNNDVKQQGITEKKVDKKPQNKKTKTEDESINNEIFKKNEEKKKTNAKQYIKDSRDEKEELEEENNKKEIKKVNTNQYIKDSRNNEDDSLIEEPEHEHEKKKINANQYIKDSREIKENEELIELDEIKEIKKINASQYIRDSRNHIPQNEEKEVIIDPEKEKLKSIIEEKKKQLAVELANRANNINQTKNEGLISFPIIVTDKAKNTVSIIKRNGESIWNYGFNNNEKINGFIFAELTPNKTLLLTETDRVIEISLNPKKIIWEFFCDATSAVRLKNGNTLITDKENLRVIEVNPSEEIIWEYNENGLKNQPYSSLRLVNGNTLITYNTSGKIKEINPEKELVWSFGKNSSLLSFPEYSCRLKNGNTLIADTLNSRVIEVDEDKEIIWEYNGDENNKLVNPNYAIRLVNGNTFIAHYDGKQLIEIDIEGNKVWEYISH